MFCCQHLHLYSSPCVGCFSQEKEMFLQALHPPTQKKKKKRIKYSLSLGWFKLLSSESRGNSRTEIVAPRWNFQPKYQMFHHQSQPLILSNNHLFIPQIWSNNTSCVCFRPFMPKFSRQCGIEHIDPGFPVSKPWMKTEILHLWRIDTSEFVTKPVKSKTSTSYVVKYDMSGFNMELDQLILNPNF